MVKVSSQMLNARCVYRTIELYSKRSIYEIIRLWSWNENEKHISMSAMCVCLHHQSFSLYPSRYASGTMACTDRRRFGQQPSLEERHTGIWLSPLFIRANRLKYTISRVTGTPYDWMDEEKKEQIIAEHNIKRFLCYFRSMQITINSNENVQHETWTLWD